MSMHDFETHPTGRGYDVHTKKSIEDRPELSVKSGEIFHRSTSPW